MTFGNSKRQQGDNYLVASDINQSHQHSCEDLTVISMTRAPDIHLLRLSNYPIWEQLALEEALVRADSRNWCILNNGSPDAIVMGISAKPERLLNLPLIQNKPIPVIRRFSGGGTVVVDSQTLFVSLICQHDDVAVTPYPEPIMRWTEQLYAPLLPHGLFRLRENDYVLGDHKFGGNAQYLRRDRWLHHSTLLWDYSPHNMEYLLLPERRPAYREGRPHGSFLCRLKDHLPCPSQFMDSIAHELNRHFNVIEVTLQNASKALAIPHRKATTHLNVEK